MERASHAGAWPRAWPLLLFVAFAALDLAVFRAALHGAFVSDDIGYIVNNPYAQGLSAHNVLAFFDPGSPAQVYAVANYAPLHLLAHALERQVFGDAALGYHVVNVLIHALNSVLLVALLRRSGVPGPGALLGGVLFAVHPANVEAVAWISQLKTNGALALTLGALLLWGRRPAAATGLFALGLLVKASAAVALPMAAAFAWARRGTASAGRPAWLAGWALILGAYAALELAAFARERAAIEVAAYADPFVHARTVAAVGARYLVMAASSYGVSAFQETPPALSWLDPWWLAALPLGAALAWRSVVSLRRRSEEAAYWVGAAASFAPVSQVLPFQHPMADRYLYFVLPGLIGGALLWASDWGARLRPARRRAAGAAALVLVGIAAAAFAWRSVERAALWRDETRLLVDAARHYPEGGTASFLRARAAAQRGDAEAAVAAFRDAADKGLDRFMILASDPGFAPIRETEAYRALLHEMAGRWIERARVEGHATQAMIRVLAYAHFVRGEYDQAAAQFERALRAGGPLDEVLRGELEAARARGAAAGRGGGEEAGHFHATD